MVMNRYSSRAVSGFNPENLYLIEFTWQDVTQSPHSVHDKPGFSFLVFCFNTLTMQQVKQIEYELNNRPRKTLGWKTPIQVFMANFTNNSVALES